VAVIWQWKVAECLEIFEYLSSVVVCMFLSTWPVVHKLEVLDVCLCLQGDCANCIHAVIKYNAAGPCFTLHDINSVLGVYVNDCRVHNSAVILEHNDIIRFGYTGIAYEFLLECQPKVLHIAFGLTNNNM